MLDIPHASHHVDFLKKAEEKINKLPAGSTVEPTMMLWEADETTKQTKRNTLGYMDVTRNHHRRIIEVATKVLQKETLPCEIYAVTSRSEERVLIRTLMLRGSNVLVRIGLVFLHKYAVFIAVHLISIILTRIEMRKSITAD